MFDTGNTGFMLLATYIVGPAVRRGKPADRRPQRDPMVQVGDVRSRMMRASTNSASNHARTPASTR